MKNIIQTVALIVLFPFAIMGIVALAAAINLCGNEFDNQD
jgi:hypothetical protein